MVNSKPAEMTAKQLEAALRRLQLAGKYSKLEIIFGPSIYIHAYPGSTETDEIFQEMLQKLGGKPVDGAEVTAIRERAAKTVVASGWADSLVGAYESFEESVKK
jgi:hypothetical protein